MDEQKRPRSREKRVVSEGKGVEKKGQGLGTGPVNNTGNYEDRKQQQGTSHVPPSGETQGRPSHAPVFGLKPQNRPAQGNPFRQQQGGADFPFGQGNHSGSPFSSGTRPSSGNQGSSAGSQRPAGGTSHAPFSQFQQSGTGSEQKQYKSGVKQNGTGTQRTSGSGSGMGGGKLLLIVIALVVLLGGGGGISGLFGGGSEPSTGTETYSGQTTTSGTESQGSGLGGLAGLLNTFMGGSSSSVYDFTGGAGSLLSGLSGNGSSSAQTENPYFTTSAEENNTGLDESVSNKAREKYTRIIGGGQDTVTILVYMCGTDLESQQGMATSDLKEMANATIGKNVNLLIYTGGCSRWRNDVVSSKYNQIYRISNGRFECLEENAGTGSMVSPDTLTSFIEYGRKHYQANRMCLILWDHGGGSVSGYGYDEKTGRSQSMTLAGISDALKKANVKFDFIGFDACLMATVENGIMLSQYADYMIASEETEPGVGWYYTNWLTKLSGDTSMPTIRIGKIIADDFVEVCSRQCRGQATTLSVVDLAELQKTIPDAIKSFSISTSEMIRNKEYKTISSARSKTREFAQQTRIDQIDLVDFAKHLGTAEGKSLAKALQGAVKYNKTGGSISHAYGLSIYFPYKRANKVGQMVSTYRAIGMDEEYSRCIQEFASLEVSGQISAGTPLADYGSGQSASSGLLGSLLGTGGGYSGSYSQGGLEELLGGLYGGGGQTGSILDLFAGRSMTAEEAASYILAHHFDAGSLIWQNGQIDLPEAQWDLVTSVVKNVFLDDGSGFIDLGCDPEVEIKGTALADNFDGTWLSIDRQPVAYYYLNTIDDGDQYVIYGYVPALLNGIRVDLILNFDNERPYGYIAGAQMVYTEGESDTQAKTMISVGKGDQLQFLCDYYDYDGNYRDSYRLGNPITLGSSVEIANTPVTKDFSKCRVTYCFTDVYQKNYWTPAV